MKYGLDSMGFEREQFTEAEATKSKSAADCAVGPCDCDPHRETCEQCAPYLHEAKSQEPCICGEPSAPGVIHRTDGPCYVQESTEPVAWLAFADNNGPVPLEFYGFDEKECRYAVIVNARATGWKGTVEGYLFQKGWAIQPVYATPQSCPKCSSYACMSWSGNNVYGDASSITSVKEAVHYSGQVPELKDRIKEAEAKCAELEAELLNKEGMTCGDCNDTGWLENREDGRYPCTCMTEAEPYQLLEAERDDWKSRYESNLSVNQMHSDNNAEMLKFTAKLLADIDALKKQNNAYATLTKAQEGRLVEYGSEKAKWLDAVATLYSEKEANAILTQERDALAMHNQQMWEALKLAAKTISDLETSGDLDTETIPELMEALSLPDNTEAIIKRHDAEVLRKAAEYLKTENCYVAESLVKSMAAELEKP